MDLVEFLNARLDEDEAIARRNVRKFDGGQHGLGDDEEWGPSYPDYQTYNDDETNAADDYIRRFRPLRAFREVAAKRAILAAHGPDPLNHFGSPRSPLCLVCLTNREGYEELWEADPWPCLTLRAIAAIYSDHPDCRPEWKP